MKKPSVLMHPIRIHGYFIMSEKKPQYPKMKNPAELDIFLCRILNGMVLKKIAFGELVIDSSPLPNY